MKPTKEDWDRFAIEIMTGGRSEDMIMEKENEQLQTENTKLKQEKENLTTIVANKIISDFDIEAPLKDELNKTRLEIISLEEALHLERQEKEEQTKEYQKILQEQQNEIDQLERNCDVFNEQMSDAVERAAELQQEVDILQHQLQAYKDKENKLREELLIWGEVINPTLQNNLLQILNEGDK